MASAGGAFTIYKQAEPTGDIFVTDIQANKFNIDQKGNAAGGAGALPKRPMSAGRKRPQSAGRVGKLKSAVAHAKPEDEDPYASMPR